MRPLTLRITLAATSALAVAGLVMACSSSDSSGATPVTGDDAGDAGAASNPDPKPFAKAQCAAFQRCMPVYTQIQWGDVAGCEAAIGADAVASFSSPGTTIPQAQLDTCIALLATRACDDLFIPSTECDFHGTLADGEACSYGHQCASGSCFLKVDAPCGVCATPAGEGESCANAECAVGANLRCSDSKKCAKIVPDGQACDKDKPCRPQHDCVSGTCHARLGKGETCTSFGASCDLTKGQFCFPRSDGKTSTCDDLVVAKVGEKCGQDSVTNKLSFCAASTCPDLVKGSICVPYLKEGASCGDENDTAQCEPGLVCNNKKCAALGCQ